MGEQGKQMMVDTNERQINERKYNKDFVPLFTLLLNVDLFSYLERTSVAQTDTKKNPCGHFPPTLQRWCYKASDRWLEAEKREDS